MDDTVQQRTETLYMLDRGRAANSWANVNVLAAHAALDDAPCPGSRIAGGAGSKPGGLGSRECSEASGAPTLGAFRGFWMPAAWGRVMRTGVDVAYGPSPKGAEHCRFE